jgi:hypothetical protein
VKSSALLLIPLLLLVGGCPRPITLRTVTLYPGAINWSYKYRSFTSWECSVPWPGNGLPLYGTGPEPVNQNEIVSGYEDMYIPGAQPLPCYFKQQMLYRGRVWFDLSQFDEIGAATLNFSIDKSISTCCTSNYDIPPICYATTLGMSTGLEDFGNGPMYWDYDDDVSLGAGCGPLIRPTYSIGVASQVNAWLNGAHANNGFMIAGPLIDFTGSGDGLPSDNNGQVSWYSGFTLTVVYNPALNPRAPQ